MASAVDSGNGRSSNRGPMTALAEKHVVATRPVSKAKLPDGACELLGHYRP